MGLSPTWRRQHPQVDLDAAAAELVSVDNPAQTAETDDIRAALFAAIAHLPPLQREVVLLRLEAELSLEQIADIQNADYEAVKTRYRLAVTKLRKGMSHERR